MWMSYSVASTTTDVHVLGQGCLGQGVPAARVWGIQLSTAALRALDGVTLTVSLEATDKYGPWVCGALP